MDEDLWAFLCAITFGLVLFIGGGVLIVQILGTLFWWFTGEYPFVHPWMEGEAK